MTAHMRTRIARGERGLTYVPPAPPSPQPGTAIGKMVRQLRLESDIQQRVLASECEMSQSTLSHIEHGRNRPRQETVIRLARGLGLSNDGTAILLETAGFYPSATLGFYPKRSRGDRGDGGQS